MQYSNNPLFRLNRFVALRFWTMMSRLNKLPNPPYRIFYVTKLFSHAITESNDDLLLLFYYILWTPPDSHGEDGVKEGGG